MIWWTIRSVGCPVIPFSLQTITDPWCCVQLMKTYAPKQENTKSFRNPTSDGSKFWKNVQEIQDEWSTKMGCYANAAVLIRGGPLMSCSRLLTRMVPRTQISSQNSLLSQTKVHKSPNQPSIKIDWCLWWTWADRRWATVIRLQDVDEKLC